MNGKLPITGFVLAGGLSSRMGQDKALLRTPAGELLMERALRVMAEVAQTVRVGAPRARYKGYDWAADAVEDIYTSRGPMGGIHAALLASDTDWNLITAVDMPSLTPELLRWLAEKALGARDLEAVVPCVEGKLQPLCTVYHKSFAPRAEAALEVGMNRPRMLLHESKALVIEEHEIVAAGFDPAQFANTNTPGEFESVRDTLI